MQNQEIKVYSSDNDLYKIINFSKIEDFELIFKKILIDAFDDENEIFGDIYYDADFLEPKEVVYAYLAGDGSLTITDDLNTFEEGFKTEKDWKITKFTEI